MGTLCEKDKEGATVKISDSKITENIGSGISVFDRSCYNLI
jgi:hypothetical protein